LAATTTTTRDNNKQSCQDEPKDYLTVLYCALRLSAGGTFGL